MAIYVLFTTTFVLFCLTVLPFAPSKHWFFRVSEFPRIQIMGLTLINIFAISFFWHETSLWSGIVPMFLLFITALILVYQAWWILPYTPLWPTEVERVRSLQSGDINCDNSIKIITSNVLMPNRSANKLLDLVNQYKPHILVTLESNKWWQDALQSLESDYPYRVNIPLQNLYGMHVYSRLPLSEITIEYLIQEDIPSIHAYAKLPNDVLVKCHFLHPAPPSPSENEYATPRDRELLLIAKTVQGRDEPTLVTGDLNDVAWSPTTRQFRKVSGLYDPRIGRGFFNTFHANYFFARWPLDHIFHSGHFNVAQIKRLPSIDSDHFPLFSELVFKGEAAEK